MTISKKEEERNEKIVRGLMKLPPNRRCINCDSLGPQYVCTDFWTFVCTTCSGIHREFTHRVKSVSMSKFTTQEVDALQKGGNQRAREQFLMKWDTHQMRLPNNSNPEKIREFIKSVYVDKKYYRSIEKPSSDTLGGEGYRKASSYHSFSQSPPYDHQYEERRYGKQAGMLGRKPGSERGEKTTSFLYSPGRQGMQSFENKIANDGAGSRISDCSVASDPFRSDSQSSDFHARRIGLHSQVESANCQKMDAASELVAKGDSNKKSVSSSGEFGTTFSNSRSPTPPKSESLIDSVIETAHASTTDAAKMDLFNHMPAQTENPFSAQFIDFFADINQTPPIIPPVGEKPPVTSSDNGGWAFFDLHDILEPASQSTNVAPSVMIDASKETTDHSSVHRNFNWFSAQKSDSSEQSSLATDLRPVGLTEAKNSAGAGSAQLWNTLPEPILSITQPLPGVPLHNNESQDMQHCLPSYVDPCIGFKAPEAKLNDGYLIPSVDVKAPTAASLTSSSILPPTVSQAGGAPLGRKGSFNPFDLELEANNMFMDMSSLQATIPDPELPAFSDSLSSTWYKQDSLMSFIPPVSQGSVGYTGGELPCQYPQNITSQGSIPPLGGNPFV